LTSNPGDANVMATLASSQATLEGAMGGFNLKMEDYAIHQATLEQVFLTFARNQMPPKEEVKHGMKFVT
jgi:hypothetical protein